MSYYVENEMSQRMQLDSDTHEDEEIQRDSVSEYGSLESEIEMPSDYFSSNDVVTKNPVGNTNNKHTPVLSKIDGSKFSKTIVLYFPYSCSKKNIENCDLLTENGGFEMSYNDAINSDIVRNLIELDENYDEEEGTENKIHITIPKELYKGLRFCDLLVFIHLWVGKECFSRHLGASQYVATVYNWHSVCRVIGALGMNGDLRFVRDIEKTYPPPEVMQRRRHENDETRSNRSGTPN